jgi:hypothetical protein
MSEVLDLDQVVMSTHGAAGEVRDLIELDLNTTVAWNSPFHSQRMISFTRSGSHRGPPIPPRHPLGPHASPPYPLFSLAALVGPQYRSGIFYHDQEQEQKAKQRVAQVNEMLARGEQPRPERPYAGKKVSSLSLSSLMPATR